VLFGAFAKRECSADYPWAPTPAERQGFYDEIADHWGGPVGIDSIAPSLARDAAFRDWWAIYQRRGASPAAALALARMNTPIDVRELLPTIRAPTLVMHRTSDREAHVDEGRYMAARIPNAQFLELPGEDHLVFVGDLEALIRATREFVAKNARGPACQA
jgi:pimeloyl-ACP methyl ester carboxylesterase